jgi:hypothetical protein
MPSVDEIEGLAPTPMPRPALLEKMRPKGRFLYVMRDQVLEKELRSDFCSDVRYVPHTRNEDLFVGIEALLKKGDFDFMYAYTDALDRFSRRYSKRGERNGKASVAAFQGHHWA